MAADKVMVQFKHHGARPSTSEVCRRLGVSERELDSEFGVIATDPEEGLYTVLVDAAATSRVEAALNAGSRSPAEGVFSNPRIESFDLKDK